MYNSSFCSLWISFFCSSIPGRMADIQLGCHTIRSHGTKVARLHMYDWIILLCLAVLDGLLNIIEPFHRFVGRDMMTDLRYPLKGNTIPFWAVPVCSCFTLNFHMTSYIDVTVSMHNLFLSLAFSWLQLIAIVLPWFVFAGIYFKMKNVYDLHHGILGTLLSLHINIELFNDTVSLCLTIKFVQGFYIQCL